MTTKTEIRAFGVRPSPGVVAPEKRNGQKTVSELAAELDAMEREIATAQVEAERRSAEREAQQRDGIRRLQAMSAHAASHKPDAAWTGGR